MVYRVLQSGLIKEYQYYVSFTSDSPCQVLRTDLPSFCKSFACCFHTVVVYVSVVYHQGLFLRCSLGSDLLMMGRPGRMTEKDTDPTLNSVIQVSLPLMYGLRTAVHLFHGVRDSSLSRYFVGVNCLPIKLFLVWVDRSLICVNVVGLWRACSSLCSCSVCVVSSVMELLSIIKEYLKYC